MHCLSMKIDIAEKGKNRSRRKKWIQKIYCDGVVLEIYLDHKFEWPQEGLNYESLAYEVVN